MAAEIAGILSLLVSTSSLFDYVARVARASNKSRAHCNKAGFRYPDGDGEHVRRSQIRIDMSREHVPDEPRKLYLQSALVGATELLLNKGGDESLFVVAYFKAIGGDGKPTFVRKLQKVMVTATDDDNYVRDVLTPFVYKLDNTIEFFSRKGQKVHTMVEVSAIKTGSSAIGMITNVETKAIMLMIGEAAGRMVDDRNDIVIIVTDETPPRDLSYVDTAVTVNGYWTMPNNIVGTTVERVAALKKISLENREELMMEIASTVSSIAEKGERNIIMLGKTGSGKSTTANTILTLADVDGHIRNRCFSVGDYGSCSSYISKISPAGRPNTHVWDTPGLEDQYHRDEEFLSMLGEATTRMGQVSAYVLCVSDASRVPPDELKLINRYKEFFGEQYISRLALVFTKTNQIDQFEIQKSMWAEGVRDSTGYDIPEDRIHNITVCEKLRDRDILRMVTSVLAMMVSRPLRVGLLARVVCGLYELQGVVSARETEDLRKRLFGWSRDTVREALKQVPVDLTCYKHTAHTVRLKSAELKLTNGEIVRYKAYFYYGEPDGSLGNVLANVLRTLRSRNNTIAQVFKSLEEKGLVCLRRKDKNDFDEPPTREGHRKIVMRFQMVDVNKKLTDDMKQYLNNILDPDVKSKEKRDNFYLIEVDRQGSMPSAETSNLTSERAVHDR